MKYFTKCVLTMLEMLFQHPYFLGGMPQDPPRQNENSMPMIANSLVILHTVYLT